MRIEWDPLDAAVATCLDGVVRVHESGRGREYATNMLDMRWLADGVVLTIDAHGRAITWRDGKTLEMSSRVPEFQAMRLFDATISTGGDRFVAIDKAEDYTFFDVSVVTIPPRTIFRPKLPELDSLERIRTAISGDGRTLAVGYLAKPSRSRAFAVFDIEDQRLVDHGVSPAVANPHARHVLELDYAGRRLVQAVEDPGPALGAIRIGRGEQYRREMTGGTTAVALERNGELVAYAFRDTPDGARGRLRFDYLSPSRVGAVAVEVLDTQTLESELPDLAALAFSHDRRRLACLSSTGAIEIVPVP
jgi:hypothetical protein